MRPTRYTKCSSVVIFAMSCVPAFEARMTFFASNVVGRPATSIPRLLISFAFVPLEGIQANIYFCNVLYLVAPIVTVVISCRDGESGIDPRGRKLQLLNQRLEVRRKRQIL